MDGDASPAAVFANSPWGVCGHIAQNRREIPLRSIDNIYLRDPDGNGVELYCDKPKANLSLVLIQALEAQLDPAMIQLLLDIDAFCELAVPPEDPALTEIFELLRA